MSTIRCYKNGTVKGMVEYTSNLDHWDGHNYTSGSTGHHIGVSKTKSGEFYVCHGTQWQGERDYAEIITEEQAKELCLHHKPAQYLNLFGEELPEL